MEVYTFEKSYLERLKEAEAVLSWDGAVIPASQVRSEWKSFVELQIEPTGWQAIWRIPRVICEDLKLRYPTIVYGYVDQVIFEELKAVFVVTAVQDNDVHLPERNEVHLIELWPTLKQENSALNVDTTAECVDRLRFFYTYVWMPWDKDYDDDRDWVQQHLESRIQLACDLSKNKLSRPLACHVRSLTMEARYIEQRLEYLELDLSDAEAESDDEAVELKDNGSDPSRKVSKTTASGGGDRNVSLNMSTLPVTDLMCLHLRMAIIRSEFEILENTEMRRAYSELKANGLKCNLASGSLLDHVERPALCHLVTVAGPLQQQMDMLLMAKHHLGNQKMDVSMGKSLQDVLTICQKNDSIFLSPGQHTIKFLEHFNDKGCLKGLAKSETIMNCDRNFDQLPVICSSDEDSTLLVIDGDYTFTNLVFNCSRVRRGILLRNGNLCLKGCRLTGDGHSSTQEGIVCLPGANLELKDCLIEDFGVGISMRPQSQAELGSVTIRKTLTGMELLDRSVAMNLQGSKCIFENCCVGIIADGISLPGRMEKELVLKDFNDLKSLNDKNLMGNCNFVKCRKCIRVFNESNQLMAKHLHEILLEEGGEEKENIKMA
ncbi:uncharacterized protein Dwil_GK23804 [Drosophila willistoni]|uniref:Right handed beta helix domain-containing protein n=1 Tax=Drosophila willistoni TaxID=7260 RepID=B4MTM3_DROWI|nr:protein nessun dorma [Drosophila willistoni]EDW75462.1 uncharacterized protein Dwil_GK23804 [Drosophila willistoni]